jgi:geranylgeranyl diphosphate synthase, type II
LANKKTFLMIHALDVANKETKAELHTLLQSNSDDKVEKVLQIFTNCQVDEWAKQLKERYLQTALQHLEDIAVSSKRKEPLRELANFLINRNH